MDDRTDVEELLGALRPSLDGSPVMVTIVHGDDNRLLYQNAESVRVLGRRQLGLPITEAFADYPPERWDRLADVRRTGQPVTMPRTRVGLLDVAGEELVLRYVMAPLGAAAPFSGVVLTAVDASGEARAEQAAERARLLTRITEHMNAAPDADTALHSLTADLVPALADIAAVYVLDGQPGDDGAPRVPAAMALNPRLVAAVGAPPAAEPRSGPSPWDAALAAGRTVFIELDARVEDQASVRAGATRDWLLAAGARNLVVVPLLAGGTLSGALVLLSAAPRAAYRSADTAFFEDVAARAGAAVAHVQAFQRQVETALTLQRALLPAAPPELAGLQVAARYVAGSTDVEVGGDWWDIHLLRDGQVGLGVGDVSGRGVPAAVLMGQARAGMRAAAHAHLPPADVLAVLDHQVRDLVELEPDDGEHRLPARFATAVYAVLDLTGESLRVANAGHPPLLVRYPDGRVDLVQAPPGPPLGLGVGGYTELVVPFPAGSLLVAFTDGLVESRTVDLGTGIAAAVETVRGTSARTPVDEVADRLLALAEGDDDTALIVVRLPGS